MANVNIKFNGKEFLLSCDDGQEEHLEELSLYLNDKFPTSRDLEDPIIFENSDEESEYFN